MNLKLGVETHFSICLTNFMLISAQFSDVEIMVDN